MLTGKAKVDFEKWVKSVCTDGEVWCIAVGWDNGYNYIEDLYDSDGNRQRLLLSLIIEWLDSVGIGVDTYTNLKTKGLEWSADIMATFDISPDSATINLGKFWKTRTEATKSVIEKANEIYNASQDALKTEKV